MTSLFAHKKPHKPSFWIKVKLWRTLRLLKSEDPERRLQAAIQLGHLRSPAINGDLVCALIDPEEAVREAVHNALTQIDRNWAGLETTKAAVPYLLKALKDDLWEVRQAAAQILGEIKDERAVKPLVLAALRVDNWMVRSAAAEALGKIGNPRALRALTAAMKHRNTAVQKRAAEALNKIDPNWEDSEVTKKSPQESAG